MARPGRGDRSDDGFTLVEVLVVVFIISLMSGAVIMAASSGPSPAQREAESLTVALNRASRESIVSGLPIAWGLRGREHIFERYEDGEWRPMFASEIRPTGRLIDDEVGVTIVSSAAETPQGDEARRAEAGSTVDRKVMFLPTGEATPATIEVSGPERFFMIVVDPSGEATREDGSR